MKVADLIALLSTLQPDSEVMGISSNTNTNGVDLIHNVVVERDDNGRYILAGESGYANHVSKDWPKD
jgi:hypothetical protein